MIIDFLLIFSDRNLTQSLTTPHKMQSNYDRPMTTEEVKSELNNIFGGAGQV